MGQPFRLMVEFEVNSTIQIEMRLLHKSPTDNILGEGLSVNKETGRIAWVDIIAGRVFLSDIHMSFQTCFEGFTFPTKTFIDESGRFLVLHQGGLSEFDESLEKFILIHEWPEDLSDLRFNDAALINLNEYWVTTMSTSNEADKGKLWVWKPPAPPNLIIEDLKIPNSLAFDKERQRLYFCDSSTAQIYFLDLSKRRKTPIPQLFSQEGDGLPDGSAVDKDGNLWNCRWDAALITVFDHTGKILRNYAVSSTRPTSCELIAERGLLIVTSAQSEDGHFPGRTAIYEIDNL